MKVTVIPVLISVLGISTGTGGLGNKRTCEDNPNYGIVEIGQNTEKRPVDLNSLVVTKTLVNNHYLTQV